MTSYTPTQARSISSASRWVGLALLSAVVVSGVGYVVLTNAVATKGYEIRALTSELNTLKTDTQKLEGEAATKQASVALPVVPEGTYVAVQHIEYLTPQVPQVGVAVR
jgi:hypothetical protein